MLGCQRSEPGQVGKYGKAPTALTKLVVLLNLRMAVPVGGISKLDRDEWLAAWAVEARSIG